MPQRFLQDSLGSRFIKSLISQEPISVYTPVSDGHLVLAGCFYVYNTNIIRCTETGILPDAGYTIIHRASELNKVTYQTFHSTCSYYDAETHKYLGKYLRYLKSTSNLNLLPFYNCYSSKQFNDMILYTTNEGVKSKRVQQATLKEVAVPVLPGRKYSIFIDCPSEVLMKMVVHDSYTYVDPDDNDELVETSTIDLLVDCLKDKHARFYSLSSENPVVFDTFFASADNIESVKNDTETVKKLKLLQSFSNYLYLVIQLPVQHTGSIVVLEDMNLDKGITCDKHTDVRKYNFSKTLSLTVPNLATCVAYSDRLLEYLLEQCIHELDHIPQNIAKIQQAFQDVDPTYESSFRDKKRTYGIWDSDLGSVINKFVEEKSTTMSQLYDQDGNINRDLEKLLSLKEDY